MGRQLSRLFAQLDAAKTSCFASPPHDGFAFISLGFHDRYRRLGGPLEKRPQSWTFVQKCDTARVEIDPRKYRNYVIAASVGGFLLPMVGLVGAFVFWTREDMRATKIVGAASFAGAIAYGILFGALA
jgi:hypothetical protein